MFMKIGKLTLVSAVGLPALLSLFAVKANADASLVSVVVCDARNICQRVMVDKAAANLYKTAPMGSIVINSSVVENEDQAKSAMRECSGLKRKLESSASEPETSFSCRLEPAGDSTH